MNPLDFASAAGNIVTSSALAIAGIAALAIAVSASPARRVMPPLLAGAGGVSLLFLAADEGIELHDRVGRWLYHEHGIESPGPINHVDDLFILLYVAIAGIVGLLALPSLLRTPAFLVQMIVVGSLFAIAAALDAFGTPGSWTDVPEEALETCGAVALAIIFVREASALASEPHAPIATTRRASPSAD